MKLESERIIVSCSLYHKRQGRGALRRSWGGVSKKSASVSGNKNKKGFAPHHHGTGTMHAVWQTPRRGMQMAVMVGIIVAKKTMTSNT